MSSVIPLHAVRRVMAVAMAFPKHDRVQSQTDLIEKESECVVFVFPLHAARRAMAAAPPLPKQRQRHLQIILILFQTDRTGSLSPSSQNRSGK